MNPFVAVLTAMLMQAEVPPVPGLCAAPVPENRDMPGCYKTGEIALVGAPAQIHWHIYEFETEAAAVAQAARHRWATVTQMHGRHWLYVLGAADDAVAGGVRRAVIGPLPVATGPQTAHFAASVFPPGMRTRVHSHLGPEAFYIVEGEQCMETPVERQRIGSGGSYIVLDGLHVQAAPRGRRNLVLIIAPAGAPMVIPGGEWRPTDYCN